MIEGAMYASQFRPVSIFNLKWVESSKLGKRAWILVLLPHLRNKTFAKLSHIWQLDQSFSTWSELITNLILEIGPGRV